MHIALLTDGITPYVTGGMQRHSFHLAKHLLKKGVRITLVHCVVGQASFPLKSDVFELMEANHELLEIHTLRFPKMDSLPGHYLRESYRYSCMIYEVLEGKWGLFDFIYAKGYTSWCLLENKMRGKHFAPIGVKFHGYEMFQRNPKLKGKLEQFMLRPPVVFINRNADVVFSYGGAINDIITKIGVPDEKIVTISSGIDDDWIVDHDLEKGAGKRKFLFVGRNEKRKGLADLRAISDFIASLPIEFHFVGPLPPEKGLKTKNCIYHGEVKDSDKLVAILDECQVLVTPSHSEGMPNVILEAMARGLAIIATDVGAVSQLVDGENGILISPQNPLELKGALKKMSEMDNDLLMKMRKASVERVSTRFRWSAIAEQTLQAIRRITFTQN